MANKKKQSPPETRCPAGTPRTRLLLTAVFFISGGAGLGYQVVWAKVFAAGVGHEFPAVLAVVTAFMAGMALGAWIFDRLPEPFRTSPRAYGFLELIIALWGAATFLLIPAANQFILEILGPEAPALKHWTVVFLAVLLTLLPATAAMGATLPAIELTITGGLNRTVTGLLYGANTAGAVAGTLAAAFWLMPWLGLARTVLLFAGLNALCGIAGILLPRGAPRPKLAAPARKRLNARLAITLAAAGLLGIGFETVIIRLLAHALENTVYTFAAVLAVYLLGHAAGAGCWHTFSRKGWRIDLSTLLLTLGAACLLSGICARWLLQFYPAARGILGDSPLGVMFSELSAGALLFFLPALAMGATFAHLAAESLQSRQTLAWAASLNTAGAALAPALFGTILFPALGSKGTLWLIALGYFLLVPKPRWAMGGVLGAALLGLALPRTADLIEVPPGMRLVELRQGVMATVSILESTNQHRVLKVNNRFQMGGTAAAIAEERHADIPLLLHPNPKQALFLGLGTGITFATALNYPSLEAHGVELVPEVAEVMPRFIAGEENPFQTPPLQTFIADARRFILTTPHHYDVIVGDLFHPAQDGAGFLYTREHFQAIRQRLNPGGLFCQWLPLYQMNAEVLGSIVAAFLRVFPEASGWLLRNNIDTPVLGLVGFTSPPPPFAPGWVERRLDHPELANHLRKVALADSVRLFGSFLAATQELAGLARGAEQNTDDHPVVIFRAPAHAYARARKPYSTFATLLNQVRSDASALPFTDDGFTQTVQAYITARDVYLEGLIHEAEGRVSEAVAAYIQSARISREFTSGYAQGVTIATALARSNPAAARHILEQLAAAQPDRPLAADLLDRLGLRAP